MTQPIDVYRLGEDFYVPYVAVTLNGSRLADNVIHDVMQVTYRDSIDEIDSFELTLNNLDARRGRFKYEPFSDESFKGLFDPGVELELAMGYMNNHRLMLSGQITTLEPNYLAADGSTLSVRGLNVLHRFRRKQHTWAWNDPPYRDSEVAEWIGHQPVSDDRPGIGMEVHIDPKFRANEQPETIFMDNQYDIVFLMARARRRGYALYLGVDSESGEQYLNFGPSDRPVDVTYKLEWGRSLTQFSPTLTTANQISQVTVRGWDRRRRRAITGTARLGDRGIEINRDLHAVATAVEERHEVVVDQPIRTQREADNLATDILRNQLHEMIKASGATVGLPDLRAGRTVHIMGVGPRFSGVYFITETTHTIGDDGYRTTFQARREGPLPKAQGAGQAGSTETQP